MWTGAPGWPPWCAWAAAASPEGISAAVETKRGRWPGRPRRVPSGASRSLEGKNSRLKKVIANMQLLYLQQYDIYYHREKNVFNWQ